MDNQLRWGWIMGGLICLLTPRPPFWEFLGSNIANFHTSGRKSGNLENFENRNTAPAKEHESHLDEYKNF